MSEFYNSHINIEKNWEILTQEFAKLTRAGAPAVWAYICQTDFKTAPASTKFHLCYKGGLAEHTINVLRYIRQIQSLLHVPDVDDESITLTALLHDVCKVNYYEEGEEWDKEHKEKYNQWIKKKVWKVHDQIPLGHGEKSVMMVAPFISLTVGEMAAIRWHMHWSDPGVHFFYPSGAPMKESMDRFPLLKLLILGDQAAELYESYAYPDSLERPAHEPQKSS